MLNHLLQLVLFDLPDDYFQTLAARLEGVTLSDVHRMASQHIDNQGLQLLVVGDREVIEQGIVELGIPVVHLDPDGAEI